MTPIRLSRRSLLRGAGGVCVGLPALEAMAQVATAPRRLVIFYTPNGTNAGSTGRLDDETDFWPAKAGTEFVLGSEVAALAPLRDRLLLVSGVNAESCKADVQRQSTGIPGDLHSVGLSQMLTGTATQVDETTIGKIPGALPGAYAQGISVDQQIAAQLAAPTRFPTLEFGVMNTTDYGVLPFSRMIYAGANTPIPAEQDPAAMFRRMFQSGGGATASALALAQRTSVLDFVSDDLKRLKGKVSALDRQRLDQHLTLVRALEQRLQQRSNAPTCATPQPVTNVGSPLDVANFPATGKLQMDLLALALTCDLTRVASLQWSWARSNVTHTWAGASEGHHTMSHEGGSPQLTRVNAWYAQQLAYLGQTLLATPDVDNRGVLDNTVIYWCSEVAWAYTHTFDNVRAVFLGSCGGALKTGQHLKLSGEPHQKLLVTLMRAMGLPSDRFGDASYGTGPLPGVLA